MGPKPMSVSRVSKETGISSGSLYEWLKQARGENPIDIPKERKDLAMRGLGFSQGGLTTRGNIGLGFYAGGLKAW